MTFELLVLLICIIGSSTYIHINPKFMRSLQVLLSFFFFFFAFFFLGGRGVVLLRISVLLHVASSAAVLVKVLLLKF